jgi:metal-dependent HD superfamily phosphatase/phosphodiesterase
VNVETSLANIHSLSSAAIDAVQIIPGEQRAVRVEIHMNNSAGIFQVDSLLANKLRGSGLEPHVEVVADRRRAREAPVERLPDLSWV